MLRGLLTNGGLKGGAHQLRFAGVGGNFGSGGSRSTPFTSPEAVFANRSAGFGTPAGGGILNPLTGSAFDSGASSSADMASMMKQAASSGRPFPSSSFIDPSNFSEMQKVFERSVSPEMREQIRGAMMNKSGNMSGMMAFGMTENEKGKRVMKASAVMRDEFGNLVHNEHMEHQLDPDDVELPKETVGNYDTDGSIEVEFEEDAKKIDGRGEHITETEIEVETVEAEIPSNKK